MKKETYLRLLEETDEKIKILHEARKKLKSDYIESNREFSNGEKVLIRTERHKSLYSKEVIPESVRCAFLYGYRIGFSENLEPLLYKAKKNGLVSKHKDFMGRHDKIEKIKID